MNWRSRQVWVLSIPGLIIVSVLWCFWQHDPAPIRYQNFGKLQNGMTKAEVVELLGCLPGDHSTYPSASNFRNDDVEGFISVGTKISRAISSPPAIRWEFWTGNRATIGIGFDRDGRALHMEFRKERRIHPLVHWWRHFDIRAEFDRFILQHIPPM